MVGNSSLTFQKFASCTTCIRAGLEAMLHMSSYWPLKEKVFFCSRLQKRERQVLTTMSSIMWDTSPWPCQMQLAWGASPVSAAARASSMDGVSLFLIQMAMCFSCGSDDTAVLTLPTHLPFMELTLRLEKFALLGRQPKKRSQQPLLKTPLFGNLMLGSKLPLKSPMQYTTIIFSTLHLHSRPTTLAKVRPSGLGITSWLLMRRSAIRWTASTSKSNRLRVAKRTYILPLWFSRTRWTSPGENA
mmetsp:Transcript_31595/g.58217  ORF Transcript_31595/g.58217 Transcript_31595/m.58217 type:complete len:244 (+) Transcript_31595:1341-2072(+)